MPEKDKKIYKGNYKRYDGKRIYVVTEVTDVDTGVEYVLFKDNSRVSRNNYHICTKESFLGQVVKKTEYTEKLVDKYTRENHHPIPVNQVVELEEDGFYLTKSERERISVPPDEDLVDENGRVYFSSETYFDYAKDLCTHYAYDSSRIALTKKENIYYVPEHLYEMVWDDCILIESCLETIFKEYREHFTVRFIEGKSIRETAKILGKSKGSIEYAERKMFALLSRLLQVRDEQEGTYRLRI